MPEGTPMMLQYYQMKEQAPGCLLFFRLGDFYEMFSEDALTAASVLGLTLTTRDRSKPEHERVAMCGVPHHSAETYIARLIASGYKVAICEQTEDPALAKGLVSREVTRIITPGTLLDDSMLGGARNNFIASVCILPEGTGLCYADVSTGEARLTEFSGVSALTGLMNELYAVAPSEAVLGGAAAADEALIKFLRERMNCRCETDCAALFDPRAAFEAARRRFDPAELPPEGTAPLLAAGALLGYLRDTQKSEPEQLRTLTRYLPGEAMALDMTARRNLELTQTMRTGERRGSLLWVLDRTKTPMGHRLLAAQLIRPLMDVALIRRRLLAVDELVKKSLVRGELRRVLTDIPDFERLMSRVTSRTANPRDLVALAQGLEKLPEVHTQLRALQGPLLHELDTGLDDLQDLARLIRHGIEPEPPLTLRDGGVIRPGFNEQLDKLRRIIADSGSLVTETEKLERERTGLKLRIGYNRVFGYYIEVPNAQRGRVPEHYIRKQTLANNERFITEALKELESTILTAREKATRLEYELFDRTLGQVADELIRVQGAARVLAMADFLACLAEVAEKNDYCMPTVDVSDKIEIAEGRHPVVERGGSETLFVPNDTYLDCSGTRAAIITGPNMAGKSTYMRQVALIVIMAQMGAFVPAKSARIGLVDKIFTRVGASDDLSAGHSTFMLEMIEVADILHSATPRSLIILDEVGRGTSTFDGMAIARAVLEYCASRRNLGAKTMFATHYHELTALESELEGVRNFNIAAKKRGDAIIFLRKIVPGGADDSYGIEVAKLAGVPKQVVARARDILKDLEKGAPAAAPQVGARAASALSGQSAPQLSMSDLRLQTIDPNTLTPIEALNLLAELKKLSAM